MRCSRDHTTKSGVSISPHRTSQKVEHYEIATYGTLAAFAKVLKEKVELKNLLATLEEEKQCDETLTQLADTNLNKKAK